MTEGESLMVLFCA